jgi:hypothetical protein
LKPWARSSVDEGLEEAEAAACMMAVPPLLDIRCQEILAVNSFGRYTRGEQERFDVLGSPELSGAAAMKMHMPGGEEPEREEVGGGVTPFSSSLNKVAVMLRQARPAAGGRRSLAVPHMFFSSFVQINVRRSNSILYNGLIFLLDASRWIGCVASAYIILPPSDKSCPR